MSFKVNPFRVVPPATSSGAEVAKPAAKTEVKKNTSYAAVHKEMAGRGGKAKTPKHIHGRNVEKALAPFEDELLSQLPPKVADAVRKGAADVEAAALKSFGETPGPGSGPKKA